MLSILLPLYIATDIIIRVICPFCVTTIDTDLGIFITHEMYRAAEEWETIIVQTPITHPYGATGYKPGVLFDCVSGFNLDAITWTPTFSTLFTAENLTIPVEGMWIFDYFRYGTYKVYEASFCVDCMNLIDCINLSKIVEGWRTGFSGNTDFSTHVDILNKRFRPERFSVELQPAALNHSGLTDPNLLQTVVKLNLRVLYDFQPNSEV